MGSSYKLKMLLHDDVMYQILLRLPVVSLFRFKLVCRSWRALIQSSYFIRQHLHLHHYDYSLQDKNRNLLYLQLERENSPITFPLASTESFEEPTVCLELNCPDLHGCSPVDVLKVMSCNGIICMLLLNCKREHHICLWNPATKQSRVLPQSPFPDNIPVLIGFGYDIKSNDYKVVKLLGGSVFAKMRYEVFSLNTGSWRRLTSGFSFATYFDLAKMPFNNGKYFFWGYFRFPSKNEGFICFDFSSEIFRCIPMPCANCFGRLLHMGVVNDNMACFLRVNDHQTELWMFNEYGRANESWTKVYTIDTYSIMDWRASIEGVSMNGNYIFFKTQERMLQKKMGRFNVVTKETKYFTLQNMPSSYNGTLVEFKESLVSLEGGNSASVCINKDRGHQK